MYIISSIFLSLFICDFIQKCHYFFVTGVKVRLKLIKFSRCLYHIRSATASLWLYCLNVEIFTFFIFRNGTFLFLCRHGRLISRFVSFFKSIPILLFHASWAHLRHIIYIKSPSLCLPMI